MVGGRAAFGHERRGLGERAGEAPRAQVKQVCSGNDAQPAPNEDRPRCVVCRCSVWIATSFRPRPDKNMAPPECQLCEDTVATLHCKQCQENFCQEVSAPLLLLAPPVPSGLRKLTLRLNSALMRSTTLGSARATRSCLCRGVALRSSKAPRRGRPRLRTCPRRRSVSRRPAEVVMCPRALRAVRNKKCTARLQFRR